MNEKIPKSIIFHQQPHIDEENEFFMETVLGKPAFDDVKGFDFEKINMRKIEDGESHIMEYLESMNNSRLSED